MLWLWGAMGELQQNTGPSAVVSPFSAFTVSDGVWGWIPCGVPDGGTTRAQADNETRYPLDEPDGEEYRLDCRREKAAAANTFQTKGRGFCRCKVADLNPRLDTAETRLVACSRAGEWPSAIGLISL